MDNLRRDEIAEHRSAPFPASVEKGKMYGEVEGVMIDADIFGWASHDRLEVVQKRSLREAADQLSRSLPMFPSDARAALRTASSNCSESLGRRLSNIGYLSTSGS